MRVVCRFLLLATVGWCTWQGQAWGSEPTSWTDTAWALNTGERWMPVTEAGREGGNWNGSLATMDGVSLVWDSAIFVTHPGAGDGGNDISMASVDHNEAGDNVRQWEDNSFFRMADRFVLEETTPIVRVSTFGYEPFEFPPAWASGQMRIWRGFPEETDSQLVFEREYSNLDYSFTGVFRILHLDDFSDTRRPVFELGWPLGEVGGPAVLWLDPGEYWIDWRVVGGETGWALRVMEANPESPDFPTTVPGTAHQLRPVGWTPIGHSLPFRVYRLNDAVFGNRFEPPN